MTSIDRYADQIVTRSEEHMSNFEALQQVTLGDLSEAMMQAHFKNRRAQ